MGRKDKAKEEMEEPLKLPESGFDPRAWRASEILQGHRMVVLTVAGLFVGGLSRVAVIATGQGGAGWAVLVAGMIALPVVLRIAGDDPKKIGKGAWIGAVFQLFFSWLAVWYLLSNPPFA